MTTPTSGKHHIELALAGEKTELKNYTYTSRDGLSITYSVGGSGPLLFNPSPCWGWGKITLDGGLKPLHAKTTNIVMLTRGTLPSERPASQLDMNYVNMANDLDDLREHLGQDKIWVQGAGNGGVTALYYASLYPDRCEKLILKNPNLPGFESKKRETKVDERKKNPIWAKAIESYGRLGACETDEEFLQLMVDYVPMLYSNLEAPGIEKTRNQLKNPPPGEFCQVWPWKAISAVMEAGLTPPDLSKITAKTMIFAGSEEAQNPSDIQEEIHKNVKNSELMIVEKVAHGNWNDAAHAAVFKFLGV